MSIWGTLEALGSLLGPLVLQLFGAVEPGVDLMARQEIARITERVRMLEDLGVSGLRSLRTKTERDPVLRRRSRSRALL